MNFGKIQQHISRRIQGNWTDVTFSSCQIQSWSMSLSKHCKQHALHICFHLSTTLFGIFTQKLTNRHLIFSLKKLCILRTVYQPPSMKKEKNVSCLNDLTLKPYTSATFFDNLLLTPNRFHKKTCYYYLDSNHTLIFSVKVPVRIKFLGPLIFIKIL